MTIRVIKLGGSLLELDGLAERFGRWLATQPKQDNLLVVGGGGMVDAVRRLDERHGLNPKLAHWICIDLLEQSARIIHSLLPHWPSLTTAEALASWAKNSSTPRPDAIAHIASFYSRTKASGEVPESWSTTSDSLAALLAQQVGARELVLLKSVSPEPNSNHEDWARAGIVDESFVAVAQGIPTVRLVNLRA